MKPCGCGQKSVEKNDTNNAQCSKPICQNDKHVQFLKTSFFYKVLASLKMLQSTKKCSGIEFHDLVEFMSTKYSLNGDIESQVQNALCRALCTRFIIKRIDKYFLVPPAAKVHAALPDQQSNEISRVDQIFNYCQKKVKARRRSASRNRCGPKSRSTRRSRTRSRSKSPRCLPPRSGCPFKIPPGRSSTPGCSPSLADLKNQILARRFRKMNEKKCVQAISQYSLRSNNKKNNHCDTKCPDMEPEPKPCECSSSSTSSSSYC